MQESLIKLLLPEIVLSGAAVVLFLVGALAKAPGRRIAPVLAMLAVVAALALQVFAIPSPADTDAGVLQDARATVLVTNLTVYIKTLALVVGLVLLLLLAPTDRDATGNDALFTGHDTAEFFGLSLLSLTGLLLVAGANDIILLFLALELVSLPTYVMVATSRPLAASQEAGVKYFFLGAMSTALMLFGFSYLFGTTGSIKLDQIAAVFRATAAGPASLTPWQLLAVLMLVGGLAFKIAAVPLHFYAGDVYEGAATPVTAWLAFIPKTAGFVALIKVLLVVGTPLAGFPEPISRLLWILAVLTMSVGNVLGLLQQNVKRVLAYSSVAHTGYMLVGLAALTGSATALTREQAISAVLFYLAAYGIMNGGAFAVLMMLPARAPRYDTPLPLPATTAETFEDLAGQGRRHPGLGLAMAISCFGLIGIPLTVGFLGKFLLITPALKSGSTALVWLAIITVVNAAVSAAYYLRIIGAMFLRPDPYADAEAPAQPQRKPVALLAAVVISSVATLFLGVPPGTHILTAGSAASIHEAAPAPALPAASARP